MDLLQMLENPGYLCLFLVFWLGEILQSLYPQVGFLPTMGGTQVKYLVVPLPVDVEV